MESKNIQRAFKEWADAYKQEGGNVWPNETLIRIVKGDYIPNLPKDFRGKKVLDVGCGTGTNLLLFASLGAELYGCEVHDDIVKMAKQKLNDFGYRSDIRLGENRRLPFDTRFFDYLVSWNVIHYEDEEQKIIEAIAEYARVLKNGGRIFISTTGPQHMILEGAESLGNHRYKIGNAGGFRKGEIYFYFCTPECLKLYFSKCFKDILVGRVNDFLFTKCQDYFILTAKKK